MRCISPITLPRRINGIQYGDFERWITVPCGQCFACRVNKTSMWTFRLMLELTDWECASFITLTYDDEHLPAGNSIDYYDLQKFLKRLRKQLDGKKIKFYACGEYGDNDEQVWYGNYREDGKFLGRPHFHLIVFGLPYNNDTRLLLTKTWTFCDPERFLYNSRGVAPVTVSDIAYVAGYCQKKLTGQLGKEVYDKQGIKAPESRCSQKLGFNAFERNLDCVKRYGCVFWNGSKMPVPRYFRDKFDIKVIKTDEELERDCKLVFGDDFTSADLPFYRHLNRQGLLQGMLEVLRLNQNEQRRLDHLAACRAKASLRASRSFTNKSFD